MTKLILAYFFLTNILGMNTFVADASILPQKMVLSKEEQQQFNKEKELMDSKKKVFIVKNEVLMPYEAEHNGQMVLGKERLIQLAKDTNKPVYYFTHSEENKIYEVVGEHARDTKSFEEVTSFTTANWYVWHVKPASISPSGEIKEAEVEDKYLFAIINPETKQVIQKIEKKL